MPNTITSWVKNVTLHAYEHDEVAIPQVLDKLKQEPNLFRPAHVIRALLPSCTLASFHMVLHDGHRSRYWKQSHTFIKHYLHNITIHDRDAVS